jgi:hypothetical protein
LYGTFALWTHIDMAECMLVTRPAWDPKLQIY